MAKNFLVFGQVLATVLFVTNYNSAVNGHWVGWAMPMLLIVLVAVNSMMPSRFLSWLIFSLGFMSLLMVLSAFTMRWRLEPGFSPAPFYRSMAMYLTFVYISLGQLKLYVNPKIAASMEVPS
jgi:hypothetical protein